MRHLTKFCEDRSNRSGDMADFRFFKMAAYHCRIYWRRRLSPNAKGSIDVDVYRPAVEDLPTPSGSPNATRSTDANTYLPTLICRRLL